MKKLLSIILAFIVTLSLFGCVFSVSAASSSFETDFKDYTSTQAFKKIYDENGSEVVGKFAFNKTSEGLRYKREADEIFYNPSGSDRTHFKGYMCFPVCKTGKTDGNVFQVKANTCYKVEISYNCAILSEGAQIVLAAAFASHGGNADVATNETAKIIEMVTATTNNEKAIINKTGSGTITGYFTTGELAGAYDRLYILLNSTLKKDVEITLTNLKVSALSKIIVHDVTNGTNSYYYGQAGEKFSLADVAADEKYLIESKVNYSKISTTLYYDENLENVVGTAVFPEGEEVTYYVANENVTLENQAAFCGFDEFALRKDLKDTENVGFKTMDEAISPNAAITDEVAYTGKKSLKIVTDDKSENVIYIGSGYEMDNGATYRLSLRYCAADNKNLGDVTFLFSSGNDADSVIKGENISKNALSVTKEQINDGTVWKTAILYYTPDIKAENENLYLAPVLSVATTDAVKIYLDSLVISKAVCAEGTSMLKNEGENQALRFYFSYDINGENIIFDTKREEIVKRGILYASAEKVEDASLLNLEVLKENTDIKNTEITDLGSCWDYDATSGKTTFSAYLKEIEEIYYGKKLNVRGYIVLSDGTVFYSPVISQSVNSVKEKINQKDMYYELADVGKDYKDIYIYMPTSDASGKYYIRYNLCYTISEQPDDMTVANKANTGYNQETYRIKGAYLTEKTGDTFIVKMKGVLHEGELELAIKESRSGINDFIGGYHGDEIMKYARLFVDGEEITINSQAKGVTACREITFETDTTMYRCASSTAENKNGTAVCDHYLYYKINSKDGIVVDQKVTWLVDNFKNDVPMVCMFTIGRYSDNVKITDIIEYYKWDGSYIDTLDATGYGPGANGFLYSSYNGPAYAIAYSKDSGFKATVGYKNIRGLTDTFQNYVWIRQYNDNKVYFKANAGRTNQKGEVWEWTNYFNFDYIDK